MKAPMGAPPPISPSSLCDSDADDTAGDKEDPADEATRPVPCTDQETDEESPKKSTPNPSTKECSSSSGSQNVAVPYTIPPWSEPPEHPFFVEVIKEGTIIEKLDVSGKGAYMFGRVDLCDFVLEHPTISRFHAVLQFRKTGACLYDLGSTHGTFVNKNQVKKMVYTEIHVGDVIRFGHLYITATGCTKCFSWERRVQKAGGALKASSQVKEKSMARLARSSRLYIFQGPSELMLPEGDLEKMRKAKIQEEMRNREASLLRAREEASYVNGISWGMSDDAIEEDTEEDADEITWQTYKGQFTERQQKTRSKIIKRMEKVSNMKKEIAAIRAKEIAQGGLTQGQQMQIGRNEQRIAEIMEELDSLEETLNDSIRESIGARIGRPIGGRMKTEAEEEEVTLSDEDEFYDRTKKYIRKSSEQQSVETADTLLEKIEVLSSEMDEKRKLLVEERERITSNEKDYIGEDDLDVYMIGLSSQLFTDRTVQIERKLFDLQAELDRMTYLLKIADPSGEAARKRMAKATHARVPKSNQPMPSISGHAQSDEKKKFIADKPACNEEPNQQIPSISGQSQHTRSSIEEAPKSATADKPSDIFDGACESKEEKPPACAIIKPQWLGATREIESEDHIQPSSLDANESDDFVDYKDRKKFVASIGDERSLETAAPGLIIRKRKPTKNIELDGKAPRLNVPSSDKAETAAADAVALLLKHKRGYHALDEVTVEEQNMHGEGQSDKVNSRPRRILGPARPDFLDISPDHESWVPPKGQTGDGRTSLNDRLGY